MQPEIQRFCWFDTVTTLKTIWKYKRAIEGHKLMLAGINVASEEKANLNLDYQVMEGHAYSHWGNFPNIFDQSTLALIHTNLYNKSHYQPLNDFETKEVTLSVHDAGSADGRFGMILWFYEIPMTKLETFEYAVKQPRYKYRHGGPRTLSRFED